MWPLYYLVKSVLYKEAVIMIGLLPTVKLVFYFHILDLNMNEWVSVKGCILRIWTNGPYVVITTSVETLDGL